MYILEKIKLNIADLINKTAGEDIVGPADLVYPPSLAKAVAGKPKPEMGDLSLPCFKLAEYFRGSSSVQKTVEAGKQGVGQLRKLSNPLLRRSPNGAAEWLVSEISGREIDLKKIGVSSINAIGPYLNFTLDKINLAKEVIKEIEKQQEEYGKNKTGKNKKAMVEYSNANTHKEYHVGHLRNLCYGDAINRILAANGNKAIPVSYINDFGIHTAKTLWCYLKFYQDKPLPENKGAFLGEIYARSSKELKNNPEGKAEVNKIMKKIESRKGEEYKLWQKTRKWSIEQMEEIYKEMGIKFEHIFYESEFINKGREMIADLYAKRVLTKSQGAIIADLEKYSLGVLVFLRSDNTALYPAADLPLALEKFKKYKLDKSIYIVDIRQNLYFKQLIKILELLGVEKEMTHLGYEFVKLPSGMMSSRSGNVITYEELKNLAMAKAMEETKKRHQDWSGEKIKETAGKIVNGAIKFEMLKVGAGQVITFDADKALKFEGFTAAYLQYTYARAQSILRKSQIPIRQLARKSQIPNLKLDEPKEQNLILKLAKYPEAVKSAGKNYDPSEIAKYLSDLAGLFNDYYHSVPVLQAEADTRNARLALIGAVSRVIANGLALLGIEIINEM